MTKSTIDAAVMFADITDSTRLYDIVGDECASRAINNSLAHMQRLTEIHNGIVIKTIGDEIMCRFASADDCARAAKRICEDLQAGLQGEEIPITAKIGMHFGSVMLSDNGDIFGDVVNIAARMQGISGSRQIIATEAFVEQLSGSQRSCIRLFDKTRIKGKVGDIPVYQVIWEQDNLTRIDISMASHNQPASCLTLQFGGESRVLASDEDRALVIGRDARCDLVLDAPLASRVHAKIAVSRGRFEITDQSSNGTFIRMDDSETIYLRRQPLLLWGSGTICFGEELGVNDDNLVRFGVKEK